jgi:hypothetical protein
VSIAQALRRNDEATLEQLDEWLAHDKLLLSSESFIVNHLDAIKLLKRKIGHRRVRILVYLRDYPSWIVSVYSQRVKRGNIALSFDQFAAGHLWKTSALRFLHNWAEIFGWDSLRIRTLHSDDLVSGDLISDFWSALDLSAPAPEIERQNISPPWWVLEFIRAVVAERAALDQPILKRDIRRLTKASTSISSAKKLPSPQYLSREQRRILALIYNQDMKELSRLTGRTFSPINESMEEERAFLPGLGKIPAETLDELAERIGELRLTRETARAASRALAKAKQNDEYPDRRQRS